MYVCMYVCIYMYFLLDDKVFSSVDNCTSFEKPIGQIT